MYNHLEDRENVFVLAAHTFCSCVKATCKRGGGRGEGGREGGRGAGGLGLFTPLPVLVSPIGLPVLLTAAGGFVSIVCI